MSEALLVQAKDTTIAQSLKALLGLAWFAEQTGVDLSEVDFGTDDELPILAWAVLQAQRLSLAGGAAAPDTAGAGAELPLHLAFAQRWRLRGSGELEMSQLGFRLANLEQSLNLFREGSGMGGGASGGGGGAS